MRGDVCMSSDNDDEYPEWNRRKRAKDPFFGDIDDMFREMEKMMDEELKDFTEKSPRNTSRNSSCPTEARSRARTLRLREQHEDRPDGKPEIQEFGNMQKRPQGHTSG